MPTRWRMGEASPFEYCRVLDQRPSMKHPELTLRAAAKAFQKGTNRAALGGPAWEACPAMRSLCAAVLGHEVLHNRESRALQYAMRDRLVALGWSASRWPMTSRPLCCWRRASIGWSPQEAQGASRRDHVRDALMRDREAARYTANRTFRQYNAIDPQNRLVAADRSCDVTGRLRVSGDREQDCRA